jgi:hypothetical protein
MCNPFIPSSSGRHAPGIPFIVTPAEYVSFAFSESNPCNIHTGLPLRKLCKEQGGMLMLGCSVLIFFFFFLLSVFGWLFAEAIKKEKAGKKKIFILQRIRGFFHEPAFLMLL